MEHNWNYIHEAKGWSSVEMVVNVEKPKFSVGGQIEDGKFRLGKGFLFPDQYG